MSTNVIQADFQPTPSQMSDTQRLAEVRAAASVLIERMQFARQAGLSFNGRRDMYEILGYPRIITPEQYRYRYARGGIAGRVVDAMPKATWRGGFEIIEDEDPKASTEFEKVWISLAKRLKLDSLFQRVDILAAQGRYAVLLLGAPGDFNTELVKGKPEQLVYVTPFPEEDAKIMSWDTDEKSPRFGEPTSYQLSQLTANSLAMWGVSGVPAFISTALQKPVHWTRVIHVPSEGALENNVFGPPSLERVWNLLDDLDKVVGGGAEAFWLRANQGTLLNIDKDIKGISDEEKKDLQTQVEEYQHQIRRVLRTRGVNVETLGSDVANFANPADAVVTQISGSKAIPKRILTGSEMGELASSQDRENFRDQVNGRQTSYATPYILQPFVNRCIAYRFLPTPQKGPEEYQVVWGHVQVLTEAEKAQGATQWASVNNTQGSPVFLNAEIRDKWYGLPPLTPEQIQEEKELAKPLEPPQPPQPLDENGQPIQPPGPGLKDAPPRDSGPGGNQEEDTPPARARAAQDAALEGVILVVEQAIRGGNTEVLDTVLGIRHQRDATIVLPNVEVHPPLPAPTPRVVTKKFVYEDVQGTLRPTAVIETTE